MLNRGQQRFNSIFIQNLDLEQFLGSRIILGHQNTIRSPLVVGVVSLFTFFLRARDLFHLLILPINPCVDQKKVGRGENEHQEGGQEEKSEGGGHPHYCTALCFFKSLVIDGPAIVYC